MGIEEGGIGLELFEEHSIEYYSSILRSAGENVLRVCSLTDYMNALIAIDQNWYAASDVLYRGQSNIEWEITSHAYRAIHSAINNGDLRGKKQPSQKQLLDLHSQLINEVKHLNEEGLNNLQWVSLLAHLQHNGAKTNLIDYSFNPLVPLWFACCDENLDGAVYFIRRSDAIKPVQEIYESQSDWLNHLFKLDGLFLYDPPNLNQRIINQQGAFLFDSRGIIRKESHDGIIQIAASCKKTIHKHLALVGIAKRTLFQDLAGLVEWFNYKHEDSPLVLYNQKMQFAIESAQGGRMEDANRLMEEAKTLLDSLASEEGGA